MAYVTVAELNTYLGASSTDLGGSSDTAFKSSLIDYAQKVIEEETGRVFQVASDTAASTHYFEWGRDVHENTLYVDGDFVSSTDLVVSDGITTIASTQYVLEPGNRAPFYGIRLKSSSSDSWGTGDSDGNYEQAISVTARWCYGSLPNDIKYATLRLARWFYRQRNDDTAITSPIITASGATIMPVGVPEDVKRILARYKRAVFA